jgi:hypothetical protein
VGADAAVTFTLGTGAGGTNVSQTVAHAGELQQLSGLTLSFSVRVKTSVANAVRPGIYDSVNGWRYGAYHPGDNAYHTLTLTAPIAVATTQINVGVLLAASCTAYVDNAMLVVGSQAADYVPMHPADDLARCLRYFEVGAASIRWYSTASQPSELTYPLKVPKAVSPTVTITPGTRANIASTAQRAATSPNLDTYALTDSYSIEANP